MLAIDDPIVDAAPKRGPRPLRRLSAIPLLSLYRRDDGTVDLELCEAVFGVNRSTLYRWIGDGLAIAAADRLACSVGLHPFAVWGNDWFALDDDERLRPGEIQMFERTLPVARTA